MIIIIVITNIIILLRLCSNISKEFIVLFAEEYFWKTFFREYLYWAIKL